MRPVNISAVMTRDGTGQAALFWKVSKGNLLCNLCNLCNLLCNMSHGGGNKDISETGNEQLAGGYNKSLVIHPTRHHLRKRHKFVVEILPHRVIGTDFSRLLQAYGVL